MKEILLTKKFIIIKFMDLHISSIYKVFIFSIKQKKKFFLTNRYFLFLIVILVKLFLLLLIQTITKNVTF